MMKQILITVMVAMITTIASAQTIDSLKLTDSEIPSGYEKSNELICVTPHAASVYNDAASFEMIIGKLKKKSFQSFKKKGDKGSILYFEFEKEFVAQPFLDGLLWGEEKGPTKSEPDEYYAKGNILVIWSFKMDSEIKKVSKAKVIRLLP
jgi:hypothetical protein